MNCLNCCSNNSSHVNRNSDDWNNSFQSMNKDIALRITQTAIVIIAFFAISYLHLKYYSGVNPNTITFNASNLFKFTPIFCSGIVIIGLLGYAQSVLNLKKAHPHLFALKNPHSHKDLKRLKKHLNFTHLVSFGFISKEGIRKINDYLKSYNSAKKEVRKIQREFHKALPKKVECLPNEPFLDRYRLALQQFQDLKDNFKSFRNELQTEIANYPQ